MDFSPLLRSPLFSGLNVIEIESLLSQTLYRLRKFSPGSLIAQSGEPVTSFMIVLSGTVKGEMVDLTGRVIKIEDISAPGALAAAFLFGSRNMFPVNVSAVIECEILLIDKPEFLRLLKRNDLILVNFLNIISSRSQFLSEKIRFLNFRTIKGKLAHLILQAASDGRSIIVLDKTRDDLADFFAVARPSVSRALGEMEEKGLIKASGKNITIINKRGLLELTRE